MNLLKALATVSSMTLVSRILGLVRDVLIAKLFGAGPATDAFFVAFRIPNLLRRLFAEGAFSQAFVPVLAEHKNRHPEAETKTLIDGAATALFLALVIASWSRLPDGGSCARGADAAHHLPVHRLHLAGGVLGRRAQYLEPL